jgi:hypothetical protein
MLLQTPPASTPQPGSGTDAARPLTRPEVVVLEQRREALMLQLAAVRSRRSAAVGELQAIQASPLRGRAGRVQHANVLEQEIALLDRQDARIHVDLAEIDRRLTADVVATQPPPLPTPPPLVPPVDVSFELVAAVAIVFIVVAVGPISVALARLIWKRTTSRGGDAAWDSSPRLERLEHSVEAIAVEVERISEGQSTVTRLLTESPNFAVGAAGALVPEAVHRVAAGKSIADER